MYSCVLGPLGLAHLRRLRHFGGGWREHSGPTALRSPPGGRRRYKGERNCRQRGRRREERERLASSTPTSSPLPLPLHCCCPCGRRSVAPSSALRSFVFSGSLLNTGTLCFFLHIPPSHILSFPPSARSRLPADCHHP